MDSEIWILDEDEDNRALAVEVLARAGASGVVGFASADALLAHAARTRPPRAVVVDAPTATGRERELSRVVGCEPVILTTWPGQRTAWIALGATRFLFKPFRLDCFIAHVEKRACGDCDPTGKRAA